MFTLEYKKREFNYFVKTDTHKRKKEKKRGMWEGRGLENTWKCLFRCQVRCNRDMWYVWRVAGKEWRGGRGLGDRGPSRGKCFWLPFRVWILTQLISLGWNEGQCQNRQFHQHWLHRRWDFRGRPEKREEDGCHFSQIIKNKAGSLSCCQEE